MPLSFTTKKWYLWDIHEKKNDKAGLKQWDPQKNIHKKLESTSDAEPGEVVQRKSRSLDSHGPEPTAEVAAENRPPKAVLWPPHTLYAAHTRSHSCVCTYMLMDKKIDKIRIFYKIGIVKTVFSLWWSHKAQLLPWLRGKFALSVWLWTESGSHREG